MTLTRCVLCGTRCVPMADYDAPVCAECDDRYDRAELRLDLIVSHPQTPVDDVVRTPPSPANPALAQLAAEVTAETYGRLVPEYHNDGTPPAAERRPFERPVLRVVGAA